jgi:predicted dehydrogenase
MTIHRFGIVGLSWITSEPAPPGSNPVLGQSMPHTHLSGLARIPSAQVVAGCDIVPEARDLFLERWSGVWPEAQVYDDYETMLREVDLDVVCVATPDNLHAPVVKAAAEAGVKGIFCEKPMSVHLQDVDEMIAIVEERDIVVSVNHTRRWMPQYVTAREAVRSDAIGELVHVIGHLGGERAMLWRNHSHLIDLLSYYAEGNPEWVFAELEPGFEAYGTRYRGDGGRDPGLEPGTNAYVAYDNGVRAFLSGVKRATPMLSVDLIGTTGRILVDERQAVVQQPGETGTVSQLLQPRFTMGGMQAAIQDLITALETGGEPQCPPREARKTVAIIEAILRSQAAGNARVPVA